MSAPSDTLPPSRLTARDTVAVGWLGLSGRRVRAALSILGIAIGIAALVAVLGISQSSRADLIGQLDRLGTNLLTASPGQSFVGEDATLPDGAAAPTSMRSASAGAIASRRASISRSWTTTSARDR